MNTTRTASIVVTGILGATVAGLFEALFLVAMSSGLPDATAMALGAFQTFGWTLALGCVIACGAAAIERLARARLDHLRIRIAAAPNRRVALWIGAVSVALNAYAVTLFLLTKRLVVGSRAPNAAVGLLVLCACAALVVITVSTVLSARWIGRRFPTRKVRYPSGLSPALLTAAAGAALTAANISLWLTTGLEIGAGIDTRTVFTPAVFVLAWAVALRLNAQTAFLDPLFKRRALSSSLAATLVVSVAAIALTRGFRDDVDAAVAHRTFAPRIVISAIYSKSESPLPIAAIPEPPPSETSPIAPANPGAPSESAQPVQAKPPQRLNLILITIDTLRADHLGVYGYKRNTSPEIDRFAKTAVVFERSYAPAPNTPRSIPSILTALYPSQIPWSVRANYPPLPKNIRTFAEDLATAGYKNHAILTHWYFSNDRGLQRGFHSWDTSVVDASIETGRENSAPRVTNLARRILERAKTAREPFLLWVHYIEPHHFYIPHKGVAQFGSKMMDKYDHEILFVDREVGRLFRSVDELGLSASTAIFLTSDHGEAFGEHGKHWHGHALYDEQIRVPLIAYVPGVTPHRTGALTSLVDLRPTFVDLARAKLSGAASGRSLVPILRGETMADRPIHAELLPQPNYGAHQIATLQAQWKLISDIKLSTTELYDLAADQRESRNLAVSRHEIVTQLRLLKPSQLNGRHP